MGSSQNLGLAFTSDDGKPISNLAVSGGLSALPAGWSGPGTFACSTVGTGSGCTLNLTYAPTTVSAGSLKLQYTYVDNAGAAKTGSTSISYAGTVHDQVAGTPSQPGTVTVVLDGSQTLDIAFNTNDGNNATAFSVTTNLTSLPPGWSSAASTFTCSTVGSGNGCTLALTYTPTAADSNTLTINYNYTDNAGTAKTGSVSVPYATSVHDNVVGMASPPGQITVITEGSHLVSVTFATDDGNTATGLALTTDLTALPAGWSSSSPSFACATVSTGTGCQFALTYAPTAVSPNSTLTLNFSYLDNSGTSKTGSVSIPYSATADDNIKGNASPASISTTAGSNTAVNVTFTTDDGNPASSLQVTTDLSSLPFGWSAATSSFSCNSVSTGTGCQLGLTYAPAAGANDVLTLGFNYVDNAGNSKSGSVSIPYQAAGQHFYVTNITSSIVEYCEVRAAGALANCKPTGAGFDQPFGIVFQGNNAYIANYASNSVSLCTVNADGTLANCAGTGSGFTNAIAITFNAAGTLAFVANRQGGNTPTVCAVNTDGTLSGCAPTGGSVTNADDVKLAASGTRAYIPVDALSTINLCSVAVDGTFSNCATTGPQAAAYSVLVNGANLYIAQDTFTTGALLCPINGDGTLGGCQSTAAGAAAENMIINGNAAYLSSADGKQVSECTVNGDGTLGSCSAQPIPTDGPWGMAFH